jgi:hypothetical protein
MLFLAQATVPQTQSITQWLTALIPLAQIVQISNQILPAFVLVAVMILAIGYVMGIIGSEEAMGPTVTQFVLLVSIAAAPWFITISQEIVNALVGAIAGANPNLNWLVVNNPGPGGLVMNFSQPFAVIGQYVAGKAGTVPDASLWELGKWADYLSRVIVIGITGIVAAISVAIMEVMLILQALIMAGSIPLLPIFIACLSIPASRGSGQNFIKFTIGVLCWPIGWAIGHVGTMAALKTLQAPSWNASLGVLVLSFITLAVICLWMIVVTIGAPALIARSVTSGTNFAAGLVGGFASSAGQHAANATQSGGAVAGALAGSAGGPAGAALGASIGGMAGGVAAAPIGSATEAAGGISGEHNAVPSSRSAGVADAAIAMIKKRA